MRKTILVLALFVLASAALAVTPGTEVYLPSVGHGQGSCAGSVCSQWRSDAWVYNPSTTLTAHVTIYLLGRVATDSAQVGPITVTPGETKEFLDIVATTFNKDKVYGSLRFSSDNPIVVTGRIYDENVVTNIGTGTAGQFFGGLSADQAIGVGKSTDLIGLAQDAAGVWRSNYGFVETTGNAVTITLELLDSKGVVLASYDNPLAAWGSQQPSLAKFPGAPKGLNQRIRARATAGTGKFLAYASRVDNRTGDPSTVEMTTSGGSVSKTGRFDGVILKADNTYANGGLTLNLTTSTITSYSMVTGLPCPTDAEGVVVDTVGDNVTIDASGHFTATIPAWPYKIGTTTVFTTAFTLTGDRNADGSLSGTLTTVTTGGINRPGEFDYSQCNGTITGRIWRAGYTGSN